MPEDQIHNSLGVPELPKPLREEIPTPLPETIGAYTVEGFFGHGGMSILYIGVHPVSKESAVIKVLSPKYLSNKQVVQQFLNEAKIISLTDHPHIVHLYDYGEWEGGLYIAMEFIRGTSLRKILSQQPFSLKKALDVILQTSYALCHLHTHGVVHGDVKPENILITESGDVKVIDFGIARILSEEMSQEKLYGLMGTPIYMSPEQQKTPHYISFQSDIYSLGILAYELVLGKITHGRIILSLAPKGMQKILAKALQPHPEDRYQDIVDFITDITLYMNSEEMPRDRPGSDYFFELFESLETVQARLLPDQVPNWPYMDIGLSRTISMGLHGLYFDFFSKEPSKQLFFAAKCASKGGEGVLEMAMLRSQVRIMYDILLSGSIHTFIEKLEQHIHDDLFATDYQLFFAIFECDPIAEKYTCTVIEKQFDYCLLVEKNNALTEIHMTPMTHHDQYMTTTYSLVSQDRLLFLGVDRNNNNRMHIIKKICLETLEMSPQKQVDLISRKLRFAAPELIEDTSSVFLSIAVEFKDTKTHMN